MEFHYYENSRQRIKITEINPLDDYKLRVVFSNDKIKIFDFKPKLNFEFFRPLKDKTLFSSVKLSRGTAFWEYDRKKRNIANDIDIAPERMYWDGVPENSTRNEKMKNK